MIHALHVVNGSLKGHVWNVEKTMNKKPELKSVEEMMQMSLKEITDYYNMVNDNSNSAWHVKRVKQKLEEDAS